jgi:Protein ENHANCED DISEASE RESISTANCE 2, C-terminal/PH domain
MTERGVAASQSADAETPSLSNESVRKAGSLELDLDISSNNDIDNDVMVAREVAFAIQKNPNLTPAELKHLMAKAEASRLPPTPANSKKSPMLKSLSKGVKSSVKKALKPSASHSASDRALSETATTPRGNDRLGDFLESGRKIPTQDHSEGDDSHDVKPIGTISSDNKIRITGIIWKRRSGLGKYSTTSAWERRRVVLKGSKLYYYRTTIDTKDDETDEGAEDEASPDLVGEEPVPVKSKSWFDAMAGTKSTSKKDPRGYLDLVKEHASIGASSGHSGAPTPFSLSIKIMTQTKWKFCFDTHGELMQWLAAMTDVIVQGSVDDYNTAILAANDPSRLLETGYTGQLSEPPLIANSGTRLGGHRLWVTGHYRIQSDNYPDGGLEDVSDEELDDVDSDADDNASHAMPASRNDENSELVVAMTGGQDIWGVPDAYIWHFWLLLNFVIVLARASSTTVEIFWYLLTFGNVTLFGFMTKERIGGKVKSVMSAKMARRLSTVAMNTVVTSDTSKISTVEKKIQAPAALITPKAGTTSMQIKNPTDLPVNKDGAVFSGWRRMNPGVIMVRSHNYKKDKIKVPSPGELYQCVHMDIFESRQRYPDMASRVQLPEVRFNDEGAKTWNAPDIFVVSIAIPTDPPKLYSSSEDGGGYTITAYFTMHEETRDILKRVTADGYDPMSDMVDDMNQSKVNAVRLLDEWCRRSPTDDSFCARFKVVPNAQNLKEIGLPSWISKYNGKPFLIKRPGQTGFLYRHPEKSCVEFDISLHPFPYLAKQGINFMKDSYFKKVLATFGFLIEGRAEDELPECLIGLMQLCYPDPVHAIQGEDLMEGKSPKSFE